MPLSPHLAMPAGSRLPPLWVTQPREWLGRAEIDGATLELCISLRDLRAGRRDPVDLRRPGQCHRRSDLGADAGLLGRRAGGWVGFESSFRRHPGPASTTAWVWMPAPTPAGSSRPPFASRPCVADPVSASTVPQVPRLLELYCLLVTGGSTGNGSPLRAFRSKPSATVYALWEHDNADTGSPAPRRPAATSRPACASSGAESRPSARMDIDCHAAPYAEIDGDDHQFQQVDNISFAGGDRLISQYSQAGLLASMSASGRSSPA